MGCTPEPTGDPERTSTLPALRRDLRSLARTAGHGLVYGLTSAAGGAVVTGLVWWYQR